MDCPCKNCICVAICSNKLYGDLIDDCSLLREFMADPFFATKGRTKCLKDLQRYLKPSTWKMFKDGRGVGYISGTTNKIKIRF